MGQPDHFNQRSEADSASTQQMLKTLSDDLQHLQQDVVSNLSQDIQRLQTEKSRLLNEIDKLHQQQQALQAQENVELSRQQVAQQQVWAKQLAIALANHLYTALNQRVGQPGFSSDGIHIDSVGQATPPNTPTNLAQSSVGLAAGQSASPSGQVQSGQVQSNQIVAALDETVGRAIAALRHDLGSYESALSQQINRMHGLGQQGEAILEVLVGRINQHLQMETARHQAAALNPSDQIPPPIPTQPATQPPNVVANLSAISPPNPDSGLPAQGSTLLPTAPVSAPEASVAPVRSSERPAGLSQFKMGLILILLSTVSLSLHNVVVGIVGNPSNLLGFIPIGGFIKLNSFSSSLLILCLRMIIVVPLMVGLAGVLYPAARSDIKSFIQSRDRRLMSSVIGSGFFLFLSQILIYLAIGQIGPGIAVTILFMYPLVTVPLAWMLFGDRPTRLRWLVMGVILAGIILSAKASTPASFSAVGVWTAVFSGVCFALYLISMQISFRKLHPVPVSLIQFSTIFVLSLICLSFVGIQTQPSNWSGFLGSGLILGMLTLAGYLLNNFGVRYMGAARASIIAASGPALTALLSLMLIPGPKSYLNTSQILGILAVTLGVVMLSIERLLMQNQAPKATR
jgi:drug/metabolite transporter (DMT)-like permease